MPVGKSGRTGEVRESWSFVRPLIIVTIISWPNGEVYREKQRQMMHGPSSTYAQGPVWCIPPWGPNSELHTDLQLTMDMPERYTYRFSHCGHCPTIFYTELLVNVCNDEIRDDPCWGLARQYTAGGTLLPWKSSFYGCSRRARFRSLEACGQQQWGIDPRTDDAGGGREEALVFEKRELSSLSLLATVSPSSRARAEIPHYYSMSFGHPCIHHLDHQYFLSTILIQYTTSLLFCSLQDLRHFATYPLRDPGHSDIRLSLASIFAP